jgi:penicillin amidase
VNHPTGPLFGSAQARDAAIAGALAETVNALGKRLGTDPAKWSWGALHPYAPKHPLAAVAVLGSLLGYDIPATPTGGDGVTVNNASIDLALGARPGTEPDFTVQFAPAARLLLDVGSPDQSRVQTPLGESGNPRSPHFHDEIAKWVANDTHQPMPLSPAAIAALPHATRLTLQP